MNTKSKKVMIIYYSLYGHIEKMASEMVAGVNSVKGVKGELWRVQETVPQDIFNKIGGKTPDPNVPVMTPDKLSLMTDADGFLFGTPTRYGLMSSQMKGFWDLTGGMWVRGELHGKPAGVFVSTGTQGGGQETTALTFITHFAHQGMPFVPMGYSYGSGYSTMSEVRGGSAYGAGTYGGADGKSRPPSELELKVARHQGKHFAEFITKLH
jgi:NAD(P)H dehydrogenase (quinone)